MNGFGRIFSRVFGRTFTVENPFMWKTKSEVVSSLAQRDAQHLIRQTVSCTHTWHATKLATHCGCCSQCIDRRFAVLGAGLDTEDPEEIYEVPLWTGARKEGVERTMAESYVRAAAEICSLQSDSEFFVRYPVVNSLTREFAASAEETAQRILDLHRRHAGKVCSVTETAIKQHAQDMLRGTVPPSSLVRIVAGGSKQSTDWRQFAKRVGDLLEKGLVTIFQSSVPQKEAEVNNAMQALLSTHDPTIVREFPMFKWGVVGTKPDWACPGLMDTRRGGALHESAHAKKPTD